MKNTVSYKSYKSSPYNSVKISTYFYVYDELFSKYRDKEITFVEIGILDGGSLFMWRDFFGPKARIIGVDFNPNAKKWENEGFDIYIGSQSDESFWINFINDVGPIDLVLDDGGHTYNQQIITTEMLIGNIKDGGMLVVEDTHTSYMEGFGPKKYSFIEYTKCFIDKINYRFSGISEHGADRRVWSIRIYESIVAFQVNLTASNLKSEVIVNGGMSNEAQDYRYEDNKSMVMISNYSNRLNFLKHIPGVKKLKKLLIAIISSRRFKAKRFFY